MLLFHTFSVVEEVGGEERLASDWLTALSITVIIPIQLTERKKEREEEGEIEAVSQCESCSLRRTLPCK